MRAIKLLTISFALIQSAFATNRDSIDHQAAMNMPVADEVEAVVYSYDIVKFDLNQIPVDENLFNFHVSSLEHVIPMEYNQMVKDQIDFFGVAWQAKLKKVITKSNDYFPVYEEILDKSDMPLELKYLSVIESALNPYAVSRSGAVGPWQFMPATGRIFDLDVNYVLDERRSIEKSTQAAADYLKSMYEMFGDWYVAIASYNCGPGNVRKAIRYSGRTDYWGMHKYLPRETQKYVPKFIAVAYMMNFYKEYGITPSPADAVISSYHPVYCKSSMSFNVIAESIDMTADELLAYNPELKKSVIPKHSGGYWLNIPEYKVSQFYGCEDQIVVVSEIADLAEKERANAEPTVVYHKVRKGECLPIIARKYGCSVTDLKKWNNIKGSVIHPNQKLKIQRS